MSKVIVAVGGFFLALALWVLVAPASVISVVDWASPGWQYVAGGGRLGVGLLLAVGASSTRHPTGVRALGVVLVLAGVVIVLLPNEQWSIVIGFLLDQSPALYRSVGALAGVVLGGFLIHAARPERKHP